MTFKGADVTELDEFATDLRDAGARAASKAVAVVHRGANNIVRDARSLAPSGPHTPAYPYSITYDLEITGGSIIAEIGPDKDKMQGALGNLLEYGTSEQPPHAHVGPAFEREVPNVELYIADLGGEVLGLR